MAKGKKISMRWVAPMILIHFMFLTLTVEGRGGDANDDDPSRGTKMSFKPPQLDDEAEGSTHVPSALNCEGCKAITYKVSHYKRGNFYT